jgi:hypothetical protein
MFRFISAIGVGSALLLLACGERKAQTEGEPSAPAPAGPLLVIPTSESESDQTTDPGHKPLPQKEIEKNLDILFEWLPAKQYHFGFLMLPKAYDLRKLYGGTAFSQMKVHPYKTEAIQEQDTSPAIKLTRPADLKDLNRQQGMCVELNDGNQSCVPVMAATVFATGFANGFVTRLVLGEYLRAWEARGHGGAIQTKQLDSMLSGLLNDRKMSADFVKRAAYLDGKGNLTFEPRMRSLIESNSVHAAGIIRGWTAASEVDALHGNCACDKVYADGGDSKYLKASWALVKSRFSTRQLGETTGYTLNYLLGYIKAQNARIVAKGGGAGAKWEPGALLDALAEDSPSATEAKEFLSLFSEALLTEYAGLLVNKKISDSDQLLRIQRHYHAFLSGFNAGCLKASDDVFREVFTAGYVIGYNDGFLDGYARGYADGRRDGYLEGQKKAWEDANKVIMDLSDQLKKAKTDKTAETIEAIGNVVLGAIILFL